MKHNQADLLRNVVLWLNARDEHENDNKGYTTLVEEYLKYADEKLSDYNLE